MAYSRKQFLSDGLKTVFAISAGGVLQACVTSRPERHAKTLLRFALFSDGHYGQKDTAYDDFHKQMVQWINNEHAVEKLDFAVVNGDLFHDDASVIPGLQKHLLQLQMPWYPSHGNHDMIDEPSWQQAFGDPYNYVVEKENSAFVFLNTANEKGKYIQGDVDWVNSQFEKFGRKEHLFVIMHITPFNWTEAGFPHPEMVQLFSKQKNLKAVFHGHDHLEDGWKEHEGKYYFFDGHTGGSWGVPYHGYRVVDVLADGTIYLYQKNPALQQPVNELRVNKHTARV